MHRCWLTADETALAPVPLAITEALAAGRANVECVVSPHDYEPFSPLLRGARADRLGGSVKNARGDKEGEDAVRDINRSLNRLVNRSRDSQDEYPVAIAPPPTR